MGFKMQDNVVDRPWHGTLHEFISGHYPIQLCTFMNSAWDPCQGLSTTLSCILNHSWIHFWSLSNILVHIYELSLGSMPRSVNHIVLHLEPFMNSFLVIIQYSCAHL